MVSVEVLKQFELLKGLADDNLARLSEVSQAHSIHEGDRLFAEGSRAKDVHLCRRGKVDILIWVGDPWNKNIAIHRAGPGELFGWSALVAPYIYTASAECVESGEEIRIKGAELLTVFRHNPDIGYTIMENLSANVSARLTQTRQRLVTEWLGSAWPKATSAWGKPGRR